MPARKSTTAVIVAALLVLPACGDDDDENAGENATTTARTETSTVPAKAVVATVKVGETEFKLDPTNPRIAKPGVVRFDVTNNGQVAHALEVEGPGGEVETGTIQPGGKATLKADLSKPGSYVWYCPVADHEQRGMKGRITVAGGGSSAGSADSSRDRTSEERRSDDSERDRGSGERDESREPETEAGGY